jgi:outer membrane protein OmpA-like peptidoglycan-associated protein
MKKIIAFALCGLLVFSSCSSLNKAGKGTIWGASGGAIAGAALGYLIGGDIKSAAIGATAGTAAGATAGALIGQKMDKKAEELAALNAAKVETFEINGLQAIRVTFENGILFKTNSTELNDNAKKALTSFAGAMADLPDTDITIWGHADKTGTADYNKKISAQRATVVEKYLAQAGLKNKMTAEGKSFDLPIASNDTAEGRAQNRRVEVYVTANEAMVKAAEAGTLK